MSEIRLPLTIVYETSGVTPIADVIEALQATDVLVRDAISLLPSLIDGLEVSSSSLNVRALTQESPLREAFVVALLAIYGPALDQEIPPMLKDVFNVSVSDKYDSIVTVLFLAVVFYGGGLAIDAIKKTAADSGPRRMLNDLIALLSLETGKSEQDIRKILEAKFDKPSTVRRLISKSKRFFLPSQKDRNAPVVVDRDRIGSEIVRDVPYVDEAEKSVDLNRYTPHEDVELELHAMDRDKSSTGWAAVAKGVCSKRLKVRVMEPVQPSDLWSRSSVKADIVLVSKLTANGYAPSEIQVTSVAK